MEKTGVMVETGRVYVPAGEDNLRLCFGALSLAEIEEGMTRLAAFIPATSIPRRYPPRAQAAFVFFRKGNCTGPQPLPCSWWLQRIKRPLLPSKTKHL